MSTVYEEALADVKRLKEAAEQNVTNALIESIAPNVRKLIEQQLDIIDVDGEPVEPEDNMLLDVDEGAGLEGVEVQDVSVNGKVVVDLGALTGSPGSEPAVPIADPATELPAPELPVDLDAPEGEVEDDEGVFEITMESLEPLVDMMLENEDFMKSIDGVLSEAVGTRADGLIAEARYATTNAKTILNTGRRLHAANKLNYAAYNQTIEEAQNHLFGVFKQLNASKGKIDPKLAESIRLELEIANSRLYESPSKTVEMVRRQVASTGKRVKNAILEMKNGVDADKYRKIAGVFSQFAKVQMNVKRLMITESHDLQVERIRQDLNKTLEECRLMAKKNRLLNEEDVTLTLSLSGLPDEVTEEDLAGLTVGVVGGDEDGEGAEAGDDMPDFGDFEVEDDEESVEPEVEETFVVEGGDDEMDESALLELDEDTVVEIDENMLRTELKRMREARNDAPPPDTAGGIENSAFAAFGGGDADHAFLELGLDVTGDGVGGNGFDPHGGGGTKVHENKVNEGRQNRALRQAVVKQKNAITKLRGQLLEQNLLNLKLLYANRILMSESLTKKTKASMVKSLNEGKNAREVKLLFKSLVETVSKRSGKPLNESRQRGGGSSRVRQPGGARPNKPTQAPELKRWQKLAGING